MALLMQSVRDHGVCASPAGDPDMKVKELIRQLQEADPTGEIEACVDNIDIHFVSREPAYYDGCLQVLKRDPAVKYYNIVGAELKALGDKVQIHVLSIADVFLDHPDAEVTFDSECAESRTYLVEEWRQKARTDE
jgi:hypothetical protein